MTILTSELQVAHDAELRDALEAALCGHFGAPRHITSLRRRLSTVHSTFTLEELDVTLDDGTDLPLIFKDLSCEALVRSGRWAKPRFLCVPRREIEMYRAILAPARLGTATCYGAVADTRIGRYWLFLEHVQGVELHLFGLPTWLQAARWLAGMHARFAATAEAASAAPLLHYDAAFYRRWLRRARASLRRHALTSVARRDMDWLASRYERAVERLVTLPPTLIHGEFYAPNVLVQERIQELRICPIDWEMAAIGPGLMDLAALSAGAWSDQEREAIALAYHAALAPNGDWPPPPDAFLAALDYCRLHLAVQWLGWSHRSTQAPHEGHDWLDEAVRLATRIGL